MRNFVFLVSVVLLTSLVTAATRPADEPLEGRQGLFTTIADGSVAGDELLGLQVEQLRTELHYIQLEVERYSVDNSLGDEPEGTRYPHSINQLVVDTYSEHFDKLMAYAKPGFYPNPFTASGADDLNAVCVPFGWNEHAVGNYSYLTNLDDLGNVVSYMVVGYGTKLDSGFDIDGDGQLDGIVVSLSSGPMSEKDNRVYYDNGRIVMDGRVDGESNGGKPSLYDPAQDTPRLIKVKNKQVRQGAHGIQLALERYQVDSAFQGYPQSIDLVVFPAWREYHGREMPYMAGGWFYNNPFAPGKDSETNARCITFGWTPYAPGNFSYLAQYNDKGFVEGYALVGYSATKEDGMDIDGDGLGDGILIILWSAREYNLPPRESGVYEYYNCGRIVELPFTRPMRQH